MLDAGVGLYQHDLGKSIGPLFIAVLQFLALYLLNRSARASDNLDVVADRGYFKGEEILACEQAGVAVTLPKPQTSGAKSAGRFGKPDFVYLAKDDVYRCPAGEKLTHHFTADEDGQKMRIYLTKACFGQEKQSSEDQ
jgi:hypothetical protein